MTKNEVSAEPYLSFDKAYFCGDRKEETNNKDKYTLKSDFRF